MISNRHIPLTICEYVGLACQYMAAEGLSWSYHCVADTKRYSDVLIGEGEMIIYFAGFDYPKHNHARLSFCLSEEGSIHMICSYGVQGPGEHCRLEPVENPTKKQVQFAVDRIADYLVGVRIAYDD